MVSSEAETLASCLEYLSWEPVISILSDFAFLCGSLWPVRCSCHFIVKRWFGASEASLSRCMFLSLKYNTRVASRLECPNALDPLLPKGTFVVPGFLRACLLLFSNCPASDGSIWSLTVPQSELQRLSVFQPCCFQCF